MIGKGHRSAQMEKLRIRLFHSKYTNIHNYIQGVNIQNQNSFIIGNDHKKIK